MEQVRVMQSDNMDKIKAEAKRLAGEGNKRYDEVFQELAEFFTNCKNLETMPYIDAYIKLKGISLFLSTVTDTLVMNNFLNFFNGLGEN
ncbi:MAG: hypothetical protein ACM3QX_18470 [Syntrophomonadaceae bacterium]